jgi:glycosyltransferase involved in cell wall biosynthesis
VTKVLLLSAYEAESHRYWRDGLVRAFPEFDFHCLVLPPRHFQWRIRGNALYWSQELAQELDQEFDLVLATSMVDLATLRGIVPQLSRIPNVLYFHENQLDFPLSDIAQGRLEPAMVNIYSALAADQLVFNSQYNLETFMSGCSALLSKFPDFVPSGLSDRLRAKAQVLPVPIDDALFSVDSKPGNRIAKVGHVIWNHRWEYDKGPDLLLQIVEALPESADIQFSVVGQSFRHQPEAFAALKLVLEQRGWLSNWGYIESKSDYLSVLRQGQVVLSTALHEYQGLAVLEACASGCIPVVPDRLAYKEYVPDTCRYLSGGDEPQAAADLIMKVLDKADDARELARGFSWSAQKTAYERLLSA